MQTISRVVAPITVMIAAERARASGTDYSAAAAGFSSLNFSMR